jgi:4-amino-4-deoxy-L-arabinose transferase-like glycosyltransferase
MVDEIRKTETLAFPLANLEKQDALWAALVFLGSLALYIRTLAPDLLLGDSGEFQTVVYTLGMTHPTGYPVFVLLGRIFTLLPIGEMAWRANLFIAVLGAMAVTGVYLIVRLLGSWRLAAGFGAFVLAINPMFWFHAIIAELYIPACAFSAAIILFVFLWRQKGAPQFLTVAGLLGGLSLGVHSTVALIAPGILLFLCLTAQSRRAWLAALFGGVLGLALALGSFLALDAYDNDAGYYNATVEHALSIWNLDQDDFNSPLERLKFLYTGRQFQSQMFADPDSVMRTNGRMYLDILQSTFMPLTLGLVILGLLTGFFSHWRESLLIILAWAAQILFAINYDVYDYYVFFIPTYVFIAIWAGIGLGEGMQVIKWGLDKKAVTGNHAIWLPIAAGGMVFLFTIQFWGSMITDAWQETQASFARNTPLDEYPYPIDNPGWPLDEVRSVVDELEDNAILFTDWDTLFPYYFVAHVEDYRTEMDFHETYPQDKEQGLARSTLAYIHENSNRPIYFTERPNGIYAKEIVLLPVKKAGRTLYQVKGLK